MHKRRLFAIPENTGAFTLVEVILALGVLAFAIVPLFGLLPIGLQAFQESVGTTVQTHIFQSITNTIEQTDFSNLDGGENPVAAVATKLSSEMDSASARAAAGPVYFYFNETGDQVYVKYACYTAAVTYWVPEVTGRPNLPTNSTSPSLALVWIDVYSNKGIFINDIPQGKAQTFTLHVADYGKRL
jgi:uncharacterized protein (TIGR02598 family)